jgi:hypothetical protein
MTEREEVRVVIRAIRAAFEENGRFALSPDGDDPVSLSADVLAGIAAFEREWGPELGTELLLGCYAAAAWGWGQARC